ncbi:MAG: hypothetical protein ABI128_08270 [Rhodanobacter sp.]
MKFRILPMVCMGLVAAAAFAQTAVPSRAVQADRPDPTPAVAGSSNYRTAPSLPGSAESRHSAFHFKQPDQRGPAHKPPPQANDKATVMGQQRPWQNGRPVDCAVEPRDPTCR